MSTDCLIIGYNDGQLEDEVRMQRSMGVNHPDFRDLSLNIIEYEGKPHRAMDIFDHFYHEGRDAIGPLRKWHNADVLWMVIMYLGTYLGKRGFTFDYINLFQLQKDELKEKLVTNEYLTTVVTTTIYNFDTPIIEVVNFVREHNPRTKIIIGGPYIAKRSETMENPELNAMFKYIGGDFYVRSREGEQALVNILAALKRRQNCASIPNIAFKEDGDFVITHSEREMNPLYDNIIDYSLFPREHVGNYINVRITKGCPFACAFCSFPLRTEKYNVSQLAYIERELNAIRDIGTVTGLFFIDDTVNVPMATFKEMMRMMIRRDYGFKWHCFFRADFCDEELVQLMTQAGCQGVFLGLESANDQILANMKKTPRKEHYRKVIPLFKNAGIQVFASIFFGFPGETYRTAQETMDFLEETKPDFYRPLIWYCDPVTPIWREREKYGLKGYHFTWSHDTMDVATACHFVERCFMSFDVPVWVPDPGLNFVSLYLLQNHGMSFAQIKTFLRCFNAIIREKISDPSRTDASPLLIENLKRACQFDRSLPLEENAIEVYSADKYKESEKFWFGEVRNTPTPSEHKRRCAEVLTGDDWCLGGVESVDNDLLASLADACGVDYSSVVIAAYVVALRLVGNEDSAIVLALDDKEVFPVHVSVSASSTFAELARFTQSQLETAKQHRTFALRVVISMLEMTTSFVPHPIFEVAYLETAMSAGTKERFRFPATGYKGLELVLVVSPRTNNSLLQFTYSSARREFPSIERLGRALIHLLNAAAADPALRIGQVHWNYPHSVKSAASARDAPQFSF
jgi:anaerobic magnesium-protoporphyrin IX monomethyl ester cyclase